MSYDLPSEVAALRARVREAEAFRSAWREDVTELNLELVAERDRYREALEWIAANSDVQSSVDTASIAEAALEPKETS